MEEPTILHRKANQKKPIYPYNKHFKQHRGQTLGPQRRIDLVNPKSIRIDKRACKKLHLEEKRKDPQHGCQFDLEWNNRLILNVLRIVGSSIKTVRPGHSHPLQ